MKVFKSGLILSVAFAAMIAVNARAQDDLWHIKCFGADGHTMAVKAISAQGTIYDVKAMKAASSDLLDVKTIQPGGGQKLHVKVVPSKVGKSRADVKAITQDNEILPIKAVTRTGSTLDVKAFYNSKTGQYDVKCLSSDGRRLGIKAISPSGQVYDVKGMKELPGQGDMAIKVEAHIKARP